MVRAKGKARNKPNGERASAQRPDEPTGDDDEEQQQYDRGFSTKYKDAWREFGGIKAVLPGLANLEALLDKQLARFEVQVGLRVVYVILSSYGSVAMIRESPTPIFRGWTALLLSVLFIINAIVALAISNRELKLIWLFLRSFSTWRFFLAFYRVYPEHALRLSAIGIGTAIYAYINGVLNNSSASLDRKAYIALAVSLFLVASDTPRLRNAVWTGENARVVQLVLGVCTVASLGGFYVYRWIALVGLYFANDALLMASFVPSEASDRFQLWVIAGSTPSTLVYHFTSAKGLPSYFSLIYVLSVLAIARANSPNPDVKAVRTSFACAVAILNEVFVHGMTGMAGFLFFTSLLYLVFT